MSGPWPSVASPIHQPQRWEQEPDRAFGYYTNSPFLPPPMQNRNTSYLQPHYQQSPYISYTGYGWPSIQMYPPSPFSMSSHQPRPPPAIRSGHVDALMNPNVPGHDMYREASTNYGSYFRAPPVNPVWPISPQPEVAAENAPSTSFDGSSPPQVTGNSRIEHQSSQALPLHAVPTGPTQSLRPGHHQRRHTNRNVSNRHAEFPEPRTPRIPAAQARRPDRSSSPRTSLRRSYNRYSADLSSPSTSSDVEEAAARSPPSDRVRYQSRESRLRFFRQIYDPNATTESQLQELKASLPKLLLGDLPKDTSTTCDICAKDYSATHVQPSEEQEIALKLPCGHNFGEFCINQWVRKGISP